MTEPGEINIIDKSYNYEIKEKGSRFRTFAIPVENEDEISSNLQNLRKKYFDASHHCFAYKLTDTFKYSDAGEPSGTAGIRIYNAIEHYNLYNILIVVVRYFGGTKLGIGGLGRAYYESALSVLKKAEIKRKFLYAKVFIKVDFELAQKMFHLFNNSDNKILNVNYSDEAIFECLIKPGTLETTIRDIINSTGGKAEITTSERIFY